MDFRELQYIAAIARHQNISKAARELGVSQPTLSKFVQAAERQLGQPLFQKLGHRFLLTYAGEKYLTKAKLILSLKKELDQEMGEITQRNEGELRIAFPIMRGTYMLPCTLPVFREKYPHVRVSVQEANSSVLEGMVLEGSVDLAFFTLPIRHPDVVYEVIKREEVVLVTSADHPHAALGASRTDCRYPWMDLQRLREERFILQKEGQRTRQIADELFQRARIEPRVALEARNIVATVCLAASGYGVTLVGDSHLKHIRTDRPPVCFSVGEPCTQTSFVAAYRRDAYLPKYAKDYIAIVREFT